MMTPTNFYTARDIETLGGVAQSLSRSHHALAYVNFNLKVLSLNSTIVRSGVTQLPDTVETADDFAAAVTRAVSDSFEDWTSFEIEFRLEPFNRT